MRIIVTGGAGFIGSNLIHHLLHVSGAPHQACCPDHDRYADLARDDPIAILNLDVLTYAGDPRNLQGVDQAPRYQFRRVDICDAPGVEAAVVDFEPDAIIHMAAESHVDRSIEGGDVFVRTNVLGTQRLLDVARRRDVPAFLHVSTDEVYGSILDGSFTEGDACSPSSPYAASKAAADMLVLAHHKTYGLPATVSRCTNNFGPRQHPEKLLPKMALRGLQGEPLPVYGDGRNVRDWLYVKDHCTALQHILGLRDWGGVYNVAGGDERTNLDVIDDILERAGASRELITFVADRPGHDRRYSIDGGKLRATGWTPRTAFGAGLTDTFSWLKASGPVAA